MPRIDTEEDSRSGDEEDESQSRKGRLSKSLKKNHRTRKIPEAYDVYRRFVWFYTRSEHVFVDWYGVLEAGMAWDVGDLNGLSREEFSAKHSRLLQVYHRLCSDIPQYKKDFYELEQDPDNIAYLAKQLNDAVTAARGADISSLRDKGIHYIELEQPNQELKPKLNVSAQKSTARGHNHPVLSRLLCPVEHLKDFDADTEEIQRKLRNNEIRITAVNYPALLYENNDYDPEDVEHGLLRNRVLVRFFKHIFTSPSSASTEDLLSTTSKRKIKRPQAQLNNMKQVTPGSIVYSALMFRHCISALDDWRTEDDLFNREDFCESLLSLFEDPDDDWVKDTLAWWNNQIFGVLPVNDDDENRVPSTIDRIREQRAARKAQQNNGDSGNQNDEQGTSAHHRRGHSRARSQSQGSRAPPHQPLRMPVTSSSRRSPSQSSRTHQRSYSRSSRQRQPSRSRSPYQRGRSRSRSSHQHHHGRSGTRRSRSRSRDSQPEHNRLRSHQEGSRTTRATDRQTQSSPARPSYDLTRSLAASMAPTERRDNQMVPASSHSRTHTGRHRSTASSRYSPYPGHRGGHPRQSDQDDGLDQSPSRRRL